MHSAVDWLSDREEVQLVEGNPLFLQNKQDAGLEEISKNDDHRQELS